MHQVVIKKFSQRFSGKLYRPQFIYLIQISKTSFIQNKSDLEKQPKQPKNQPKSTAHWSAFEQLHNRSKMLFLYSWIPGYSWVTYYWQYLSADECRHIKVISEGPELPITSILTLYALTKFVIPTIIKKRGRAFDTRPLGMKFIL